jgi:hypothetical protein
LSVDPPSMRYLCRYYVNRLMPICTAPGSATLTNNGNASVYLFGAAIISDSKFYGDFAETSDCPEVLLPGQTCSVVVSFGGCLNGATCEGMLMVSYSASDSPKTVTLMGTNFASY